MDTKETQLDKLEAPGEFSTPKGSTLPIWQQKGLRQLYGLMVFLFLGSTTLGYDGSLLNGLQTMDTWQRCKPREGDVTTVNWLIRCCSQFSTILPVVDLVFSAPSQASVVSSSFSLRHT